MRLIRAWNVRSPYSVDGDVDGLAEPDARHRRVGHSDHDLDESVLATTNAGIPEPTNEPSSTAFLTISPSKGATTDVSRSAISASLA